MESPRERPVAALVSLTRPEEISDRAGPTLRPPRRVSCSRGLLRLPGILRPALLLCLLLLLLFLDRMRLRRRRRGG